MKSHLGSGTWKHSLLGATKHVSGIASSLKTKRRLSRKIRSTNSIYSSIYLQYVFLCWPHRVASTYDIILYCIISTISIISYPPIYLRLYGFPSIYLSCSNYDYYVLTLAMTRVFTSLLTRNRPIQMLVSALTWIHLVMASCWLNF